LCLKKRSFLPGTALSAPTALVQLIRLAIAATHLGQLLQREIQHRVRIQRRLHGVLHTQVVVDKTDEDAAVDLERLLCVVGVAVGLESAQTRLIELNALRDILQLRADQGKAEQGQALLHIMLTHITNGLRWVIAI